MKDILPLKTYCLDTSVFIDNPKIIDCLGGSEIIIPFCVLSELDNNRKKPGLVGKNAREAIRNIDKIRENENKSENDAFVRFISSDFDKPTNDLKIIACADWIKTQEKSDVVILSNDIGLRVHAHSRGIETEGFKKKSQDFVYSGVGHICLEQHLIDILHENGSLEIFNNDNIMSDTIFYPNQMIIITGAEKKTSTLAKVDVYKDSIVLFKVSKKKPWNVSPASVEQTFAIDLLTDLNVDLVSLIGKAGTGKSFLATACGLEQVLERKAYDQIIILRPIVPMGNDIGYLPGTKEEKLAPWIQPIKDNLLTLMKGNNHNVKMLFDRGQVVIEAMSYIRGRSIPRSFIIVDECQNLSIEQLKTVLTRAGEGSKVVLTGDIEQIDNKNIDIHSNGLSMVIDNFKDEDIAGHITMTKGQRSALATIAAEIL